MFFKSIQKKLKLLWLPISSRVKPKILQLYSRFQKILCLPLSFTLSGNSLLQCPQHCIPAMPAVSLVLERFTHLPAQGLFTSAIFFPSTSKDSLFPLLRPLLNCYLHSEASPGYHVKLPSPCSAPQNISLFLYQFPPSILSFTYYYIFIILFLSTFPSRMQVFRVDFFFLFYSISLVPGTIPGSQQATNMHFLNK